MTTTNTDRRPVREIDSHDAYELSGDPYAEDLEVLESEPFWVDREGGFWVVTRYDQCREVMQDYKTFSHALPRMYGMGMETPLMPSFFDPPYQTKLRAVVLPHMSAAKVDVLEPKMRTTCQELIGGFRHDGRLEFMKAFAEQYPIRMFSDFFGLPEDRREHFRVLADTWSHNHARKAEMWAAIRAIIRQELEDRLVHPRDDVLNGIAHGKIDGEPVDPEVAVNLASTVFLGGLDTVPSILGWIFRHLALHPELRQCIVEDPSCATGAVEEFLRIYPVVPRSSGTSTRDVDFHGVQIRKGDPVKTYWALAGQDSAVFPDPLTLDPDRTGNRHMAFAVGAHRCLGSHLARHELIVALQEWHAQIPDYHLADPASVRFTGGGVMGMANLQLAWNVAPS